MQIDICIDRSCSYHYFIISHYHTTSYHHDIILIMISSYSIWELFGIHLDHTWKAFGRHLGSIWERRTGEAHKQREMARRQYIKNIIASYLSSAKKRILATLYYRQFRPHIYGNLCRPAAPRERYFHERPSTNTARTPTAKDWSGKDISLLLLPLALKSGPLP